MCVKGEDRVRVINIFSITIITGLQLVHFLAEAELSFTGGYVAEDILYLEFALKFTDHILFAELSSYT